MRFQSSCADSLIKLYGTVYRVNGDDRSHIQQHTCPVDRSQSQREKKISLVKCQHYLRVLDCLITNCLWLVRLSCETVIKTAGGNMALVNLMSGQLL